MRHVRPLEVYLFPLLTQCMDTAEEQGKVDPKPPVYVQRVQNEQGEGSPNVGNV